MNVVDIFSGVGGLSVGFEKAGFNVVLANEIDEQIAQSYKRNHIHTIMVNEDIRSFVDHFDERPAGCFAFIVETVLVLQQFRIIQPHRIRNRICHWRIPGTGHYR